MYIIGNSCSAVKRTKKNQPLRRSVAGARVYTYIRTCTVVLGPSYFVRPNVVLLFISIGYSSSLVIIYNVI